MLSSWKYMLFLALALPAIAIFAYAPPNLENIANSRSLDNIGVFITKSLASAKPQAEVSVDPIAAANVDEDLDYRIAQRIKSIEGWRSFLTAHPDGPHAQSARAELDAVTPLAPAAAARQDGAPSDTKLTRGAVSATPPSAGSEAAPLAFDETCKGDEDRLDQLSKSPTSDGVIRFLIELRCEKLRPQLIRLAERLEDKAPPAAADAAQDAPSSVLPEPLVSAPPLPPPRMRANQPQNRTRSTLSLRGVQPKRHTSERTATDLPLLLLALFGEGPTNSTGVRRTRAGAGPGVGGH
jgi:hypothetical protein